MTESLSSNMNGALASDWDSNQISECTAEVSRRAEGAVSAGGRPAVAGPRFTFRSPSEILDVDISENDHGFFEHNVIDFGEPTAVLGQGGVGKSRIILQLAASCITGREFCGRVTRALDHKWLFVQTENGIKRLKSDMASLRNWLSEEEFVKFSNSVVIHTLEGEDDYDLSLVDRHGQTGAVASLRAKVEEFDPQFVVFDALTDLSVENLNHDDAMNRALGAIMRVVRAGRAWRTPIIIHHSASGIEGQKKASGFDSVNFGRNSKRLFSRCRSVINILPESEDGTRLIVSCGKNNNGSKFQPYLVELGGDSIYREVGDWDYGAWQNSVNQRSKSGGRPSKPLPADCDILDRLPEDEPIRKVDLSDVANPIDPNGERRFSRTGYEQKIRELVKDGRLFEWSMKNPKGGPYIAYARHPQVVENTIKEEEA